MPIRQWAQQYLWPGSSLVSESEIINPDSLTVNF